MAPGTGGSNSFVQQRQEQRSGMGHVPSRPLHSGDLSSGPTTGHPGAAWEGRLLGLPCPDPDAVGSCCTIYEAVSTDSSAASCCGAFSAQSRPCQCAARSSSYRSVAELTAPSSKPGVTRIGVCQDSSARQGIPTSHGDGIKRAHSSIPQHGSRTGKLIHTRPENTLKIKIP